MRRLRAPTTTSDDDVTSSKVRAGVTAGVDASRQASERGLNTLSEAGQSTQKCGMLSRGVKTASRPHLLRRSCGPISLLVARGAAARADAGPCSRGANDRDIPGRRAAAVDRSVSAPTDMGDGTLTCTFVHAWR